MPWPDKKKPVASDTCTELTVEPLGRVYRDLAETLSKRRTILPGADWEYEIRKAVRESV